MQPIDLDISIVNHSNPDLLRACLASIFATTRCGIRVWVIDNATDGRLVPEMKAEFPQVQWLHNAQRQGFSANHNQMLRRSTARYAMILNDDTVIHDGAFDTLVRFMDEHPDVGMAGPRLLNADGSHQESAFRFMTCFTELVGILQMPGVFCGLKRVGIHRAQYANDSANVDWVLGACVIVRGEVLQRVGLLDDTLSPIANTEEVDWCYRTKKAGFPTAFVPAAVVTHIGGQSLRPSPNSEPRADRIRVEMHRTRLAFFRKHYGTIPVLVLRCIYIFSLPTNLIMLWQSYRRGRMSKIDRTIQSATFIQIARQALLPIHRNAMTPRTGV